MNITAKTDLFITEYLDVTFNLKTGKYRPYRKQNNTLQYIHKQSNHPPSINKQILSMISRWLSNMYSDNEHSHKAAPIDNEPFKTNVGKLFLTLLQKHFPQHHKYYKLINKNNIKIN